MALRARKRPLSNHIPRRISIPYARTVGSLREEQAVHLPRKHRAGIRSATKWSDSPRNTIRLPSKAWSRKANELESFSLHSSVSSCTAVSVTQATKTHSHRRLSSVGREPRPRRSRAERTGLRNAERIASRFTLAPLGRGHGEGEENPDVMFPTFLIGQRHFWRPYKHEAQASVWFVARRTRWRVVLVFLQLDAESGAVQLRDPFTVS